MCREVSNPYNFSAISCSHIEINVYSEVGGIPQKDKKHVTIATADANALIPVVLGRLCIDDDTRICLLLIWFHCVFFSTIHMYTICWCYLEWCSFIEKVLVLICRRTATDSVLQDFNMRLNSWVLLSALLRKFLKIYRGTIFFIPWQAASHSIFFSGALVL